MSIMQAFKEGKASHEDLADFAASWRNLTGDREPLRNAMGMTREEYADWLNMSGDEFERKYRILA